MSENKPRCTEPCCISEYGKEEFYRHLGQWWCKWHVPLSPRLWVVGMTREFYELRIKEQERRMTFND